MRALAEISARSSDEHGRGALRSDDLQAYTSLLGKLKAHGVVLVTGTEKGKQVCALGLATAAVTEGRRAALLECDLSNPTLATALGLPSRAGLHEYLRWAANASQILQPVVLAGPESEKAVEPLVCIAAGEPTSHGATLLASESFRHAIAKLRSAYGFVVLDGPPLDADSGQLEPVAAAADAVIACVERADARRRSTRGLRRRLRQLPTRFAGFVTCE